MTTHYVNVEPGKNQSDAVIGAVWTLVHWHLTRTNNTGIGISFPRRETNHRFIDAIRLHGSLQSMTDVRLALMNSPLMTQGEKIAMTAVLPTPELVHHVVVHRSQAFTGRAKFMREAGMTQAQATEKLGYRRLPLSVGLFSRSTGQKFYLTPVQTVVDAPMAGTFNTYGFGSNRSATVPFF